MGPWWCVDKGLSQAPAPHSRFRGIKITRTHHHPFEGDLHQHAHKLCLNPRYDYHTEMHRVPSTSRFPQLILWSQLEPDLTNRVLGLTRKPEVDLNS